jgi:hypothetical protein
VDGSVEQALCEAVHHWCLPEGLYRLCLQVFDLALDHRDPQLEQEEGDGDLEAADVVASVEEPLEEAVNSSLVVAEVEIVVVVHIDVGVAAAVAESDHDGVEVACPAAEGLVQKTYSHCQ